MTSLSHDKSRKETKSDSRRDFLLSYFSKPDKFESKEVNGFVLNRYFDASSKRWGVMVYTKESWEKAQFYVLKNKPQRMKDPVRKTKFRKLFDELNSAVR